MKIEFKTLVLAIILIIPSLAFSQVGTLTGIITDKETQTPIPFANVNILSNGQVLTGAITNFDGLYTIKGIPVGKYAIKAAYLGYKTSVKENVEIKAQEITLLDVELSASVSKLKEITVQERRTKKRRFNKKGRTSYKSVRFLGEVRSSRTNGYHVEENYNTESYDYIKENGFKSPLNTPLSTFSIDVDAASYSNIRRFLNQGNMPPVDAVRLEEMINYFSYVYEAPLDQPFSIYTEVATCAWNPKHKIAMVGIQGQTIDMNEAKPSNLVFLLDVSGSMSSHNKLPLLKKSLKLLVNQLSAKDKISIVVYAGSAGLVLEPTEANDKLKIFEALDRLNAGGSTAGGEGIKLAYKIAKQNFINGGNNRIILATDGDFNIGASRDGEMQRLVEDNRKSGVFITVLGFGMNNYKDSKMEKIADNGNGNYAYIDNLLEAQKVLVNEVGGTLHTIAKDVKLQVEFNPANVQAYRLIGYENRLLNDEDFNNDAKDAGDLGAGKTVTALYEIIPVGIESDFMKIDVDKLKYQKNKTQSPSSDELLTVKIRYKEPAGFKSKLISTTVETKTKSFSSASENLRFASSVAQFGMILRDSKYKGTASYESVYNLALASKGIDEEGYRSEFLKLIKLTQNINNSKVFNE